MSKLLVTGASGHLGRAVVSLLREQGIDVIAGSRTPEPGDREVDFDDPALARAFDGIERLLLISTNRLDAPLARLRQHRRAIDAAVRAGVGHVVYTSYVDPSPDSPVGLAVDHLGTEAALAESPLSFTLLRNALYADNLLGNASQAVTSGALIHASGDGATAYVTRADCARVAAAALASGDRSRRVVAVTGPEALTAGQIAAMLSRISGRKVVATELPDDAFRATLLRAGLPEPAVDMMLGFERATRQGRHAAVSDAVERYTGREAESMEDFLRRSLPAAAR